MILRLFMIIAVLIFSLVLFAIGDGLVVEDLLQYVQQNYTPSSTMGYNPARDVLYSIIDIKPGNQLSGIYSDYTITLDPDLDPSTDAYHQGINCEHTFPQSMGAIDEPQKSDMHHLFPCKSNVNSSRGNDPFGEIPDGDTDRWYYNGVTEYEIPDTFLDMYAEKENDGIDRFEPREAVKGDIARAMFYFYCIYNDAADDLFFHNQKDVLLQWHTQDPADEDEIARTWRIAEYQDDKPNPFIIDETLVERIWFNLDTPEITSFDQLNEMITLSWSSVETATSYQLFTADNPVAEFPLDWNLLQENISSTQVTISASQNYKFFRIRAVK